MPLTRCQVNGRKGWRWGKQGKCYVGTGAVARALRQARAIRARGRTENATKKLAPNPLKQDPTRTAFLRRRFIAELKKRFNRVRRALAELVVKEDALGLKAPLANQRWAFRSDAEKLKEFKKWLEQQFAGEVLGQDLERAYWDAYIEEGWRKGAGRAFDDTKVRARRWRPGEGDFYRGTKQQFLETSFGIPVSQEKVKLLAERVYTDLKGITDASATRMSRVLTDGLVQGKNPREVARDLNRELDLGRSRSLMIAQTEIVRAHAEGQLDAMELLGVEEIGVAVEWSTSGLGVTELGNPSPCEVCAPLQGIVMTIREARELLPRHPNCHCTHIPANVGEDTKDQKRSEREISRAIDASIHAEAPSKRSLAEQRGRTRWAGADKTIRKTRPRELVPTE